MARKFLTPIDLNKLELQNATVQNLASDPGTPAIGQIYFNTGSDRLKVKTSGSFLEVPTSGTIVNADISASAAIVYSKLSIANGDIAYAKLNLTGSIVNADIATGAAIAYGKLNLSNSIVNGDIASNAAIAFSKLASPTADFNHGGFKITNLADPTNAQDAATKNYVDNAVVGIDWKQSVRVTTTANITLSGTQTVDGVALSAGDRILVKDQTTGANNGIYVVAASTWSRSTDADTSAEVTAGFAVFVEEGTTYADTGWVLTTNGPITLGTTALAFTQFTGAAAVSAGNGLTKSGNTLHFGDGTTYTAGDLFYAATSTTVGKLADVATGNVLISGGVGANPSYGKVGLTTHVSGTLGVGNGGTGTASTPTNGQLLIGNGTNYTLATLTQGTGVTVTNASGSITVAIGQAVATSSTPTFAGLTISGGKTTLATSGTANAPLNMVSGSAPTTPASGDIWVASDVIQYRTSGAATKSVAFTDSNITGTSSGISGSQTANYVYAAPNGSAGTASFRQLAAADIPNLDAAKITTGTLASARGGALRYAANVGDGTSTSIAVTHSLGTTDVVVNVYEVSTGATVECDVARTSTSVVTLGFGTAPASNALRVVVLG